MTAPTQRERIAALSDLWRVRAVDEAGETLYDDDLAAIGIREALEIVESMIRQSGYAGIIKFVKAKLVRAALHSSL